MKPWYALAALLCVMFCVTAATAQVVYVPMVPAPPQVSVAPMPLAPASVIQYPMRVMVAAPRWAAAPSGPWKPSEMSARLLKNTGYPGIWTVRDC